MVIDKKLLKHFELNYTSRRKLLSFDLNEEIVWLVLIFKGKRFQNVGHVTFKALAPMSVIVLGI